MMLTRSAASRLAARLATRGACAGAELAALPPRARAAVPLGAVQRRRFSELVAPSAEAGAGLADLAAAGLPRRAEGDPGVSAALREGGCAGAVQHALSRFGPYSANEKAWHSVLQQIVSEGAEGLRRSGAGDFKRLVNLLAKDVRVTKGSFWEDLTHEAADVFQAATLQEMLDIAEDYCHIRAWMPEVFEATRRKAASEQAVHTMEPAELVRLMSVFGRAGAGSRSMATTASRMFNEMEARVEEDYEDFTPEDCLKLFESLADFKVAPDEFQGTLKVLGRERLHPFIEKELAQESPPQPEAVGRRATSLCRAYGELGYRHDTIFKLVVTKVLQEQEELQKARVLGEAPPAIGFNASDIAMIAHALLRLKMYRGNTTWFKWTDKYRELLDVLSKRLEAEIPTMEAEPLAAAAFVFGRQRRGNIELNKAMYARMMQLLEGAGNSRNPPQDYLERFLHGIAMMGPERQKKELDAEWLMQWLCNNVYTFTLSDFIQVNRHLVLMRIHDKEYLTMLVPFFCDDERMKQLTKTDIMELTNTYNGARIREGDIPDGQGKHFFWAMGRQFQRLQAESSARKAKSKTNFRRLG